MTARQHSPNTGTVPRSHEARYSRKCYLECGPTVIRHRAALPGGEIQQKGLLGMRTDGNLYVVGKMAYTRRQ